MSTEQNHSPHISAEIDKKYRELENLIAVWAKELGFQQVGIADTQLSSETSHLKEWIKKGYHGDMQWMEKHLSMRESPAKLHPHTIRVISVRMDYLPPETQQIKILKSPNKAYLSRYALGRDYHKLIRKRLSKLADYIDNWAKSHIPNITPSQRAFVDSAPVLERPLAQKAGLGWIGKHTLTLNESAGSWFFLGELFTSLPLKINTNIAKNQCGTCEACLKVCPTDAFPKPYELDARRCISYLTIENKSAIPEEFRAAIGNRVFGCDDCQTICPWNKYAKPTCEHDFHPRHNLDNIELIELFKWNENTFMNKTAGSPIRRIGFERWQRNIAIGLGNADSNQDIINVLEQTKITATPLVQEHIDWALTEQRKPNRKRIRKIKRQP